MFNPSQPLILPADAELEENTVDFRLSFGALARLVAIAATHMENKNYARAQEFIDQATKLAEGVYSAPIYLMKVK